MTLRFAIALGGRTTSRLHIIRPVRATGRLRPYVAPLLQGPQSGIQQLEVLNKQATTITTTLLIRYNSDIFIQVNI